MLTLRRKVKQMVYFVLSKRTVDLIRFDLLRARTRLRTQGKKDLYPSSKRLHFGCGSRKVEGWLNVDLYGSDFDVDLATGRLPWRDNTFEVALSQHVIEHLELGSELIPLLKEIRRVLVENGEIWLSCPDIAKICKSYHDHKMVDLIIDREDRFRLYWESEWSLDKQAGVEGIPSSHMINLIFFQGYEHRNLFDFDLLEWVLDHCGFVDIERVNEDAMLNQFPEFPRRGDDKQSLYIRARCVKNQNVG